ncbi:hypothetical protein ES703_65091 [subsurface metagenome]
MSVSPDKSAGSLVCDLVGWAMALMGILRATARFFFMPGDAPARNCERSSSTFRKCSLKANRNSEASKSARLVSLFLMAHRSFSSVEML